MMMFYESRFFIGGYENYQIKTRYFPCGNKNISSLKFIEMMLVRDTSLRGFGEIDLIRAKTTQW